MKLFGNFYFSVFFISKFPCRSFILSLKLSHGISLFMQYFFTLSFVLILIEWDNHVMGAWDDVFDLWEIRMKNIQCFGTRVVEYRDLGRCEIRI